MSTENDANKSDDETSSTINIYEDSNKQTFSTDTPSPAETADKSDTPDDSTTVEIHESEKISKSDKDLESENNLESDKDLESDKELESDKDLEPDKELEPDKDLEPDKELEPDKDLEPEHNLESDKSTELHMGPPLDEDDQVIHLVEEIIPVTNTRKELFRKITFGVCCLGFVVFLGLFVNEAFIQPARTNKVINEINNLYKKPVVTPSVDPVDTDHITPVEESDSADEVEDAVVKDPNKDDKGRLLAFQSLLETNEDVKGWLTIPDTNMDYVVLQSGKDNPEFYLEKNIYGEYDKAGSLFLDAKSSVETNTQNLIIHGHNMTSTDNMFHYLLDYKESEFFKARPVIQFDSIYEEAQWKVFSVFITNGNSNNEPLFDYTKSTFADSSDFLNFIQDMKLRSYYHTDGIDINENDQILVLSTCSYELWDYRTVVVARKVREGEDPTVDIEGIIRKESKEILYPDTWYQANGGTKPEDVSFEDAVKAESAPWYVPAVQK